MDYAIAWQLGNEGGDFGPGSIRTGEMRSIAVGTHLFNGQERKKYGVARLLDVSDVGRVRLGENVLKMRLVEDLKDGQVLVSNDEVAIYYEHRFLLRLDELKVQFPADSSLIDDLFDDRVEVAADKVPEWPWEKVKACFYCRVQAKKVPDVEKETVVAVGP